MKSLSGTGRLVRLALRRDRVRIAVWLAGLVLGSVVVAAAFPGLYETAADRQVIAETMGTPGGLAFTGPTRYLDDYNFGSIMGHQMLGFTALMVGLMTVLMVVRHTRVEEETGRAELVRASVVGRHSHLTAALTVALVVNLAHALLLAVGLGMLGLEGMTWSGSVLYGFAHAAAGMTFGAVAAVTVQVTQHGRGASGMGIALVGLAYILRAAGDVADSAVAWLSPIGWVQATYVYVDDRWWPLLVAVAFTIVVAGAGYVLSTRRDVGAGLRNPRPGAPVASGALRKPIGFGLRLHRGLLIGFVIGAFILGTSYGSVMGELDAMIGAMGDFADVIAEMGGATMVESFASLISYLMAVIASVYIILAALRPKAEENAGRAEPLLAASLSRPRWLMSHLVIAFGGGALVIAAAGTGLAVTTAAVLEDASILPTLIGASLAYIPAMWVTAAVVVLLYGLVPKATVVAWFVLLYSFVVGYFGTLLQFPEWTSKLTPYGHVPQLPAAAMEWTPLVLLVVVAAAITAVGLVGFRRRDLMSTV